MLRSLTFLAATLALASPLSARAMLVEFQWEPVSQGVATSATTTTVMLNAIQTGGADAAGITLGIAVSGAVTGFELLSYGSAVSEADSQCCDLSGTPGIIAAAPGTPGSFGQNIDFEIATFTLFLDFGTELEGTVSLVDLSGLAGAPALDMNAMEIPSNLTAVHTVVPEPAPALLLLIGLAGLSIAGRARSSPRA